MSVMVSVVCVARSVRIDKVAFLHDAAKVRDDVVNRGPFQISMSGILKPEKVFAKYH
jgi:hypothetical protein